MNLLRTNLRSHVTPVLVAFVAIAGNLDLVNATSHRSRPQLPTVNQATLHSTPSFPQPKPQSFGPKGFRGWFSDIVSEVHRIQEEGATLYQSKGQGQEANQKAANWYMAWFDFYDNFGDAFHYGPFTARAIHRAHQLIPAVDAMIQDKPNRYASLVSYSVDYWALVEYAAKNLDVNDYLPYWECDRCSNANPFTVKKELFFEKFIKYLQDELRAALKIFTFSDLRGQPHAVRRGPEEAFLLALKLSLNYFIQDLQETTSDGLYPCAIDEANKLWWDLHINRVSLEDAYERGSQIERSLNSPQFFCGSPRHHSGHDGRHDRQRGRTHEHHSEGGQGLVHHDAVEVSRSASGFTDVMGYLTGVRSTSCGFSQTCSVPFAIHKIEIEPNHYHILDIGGRTVNRITMSAEGRRWSAHVQVVVNGLHDQASFTVPPVDPIYRVPIREKYDVNTIEIINYGPGKLVINQIAGSISN